MAKIDIVSGFLGAGKTTFINKVLVEGLGCSAAVVENEIGDEAVDDYLVESSGLEVRTLASGCICCSLKIGFVETIQALVSEHAPDRIVIEPTGIAGPDDVVAACELAAQSAPVEVASVTTVVNAANLERMLRLRIPAFINQIRQARVVVLSHVGELGAGDVERVVEALSGELRDGVPIIARDWGELDGLEVLALAEEAYSAERAHAGSAAEGDAHPGERHGHAQDGGHSHGLAGLDAISLHLEGALEPEGAARLDRLVSDESHGRVLRAKGFLRGAGGSMVHYEYVYGASALEPTAYAGPAKLVLIGERLDRGYFEREIG